MLAADVASYSRLIGLDEEGTVSALTAHRTEIFEPAIVHHRGRLVKTTGDGAAQRIDDAGEFDQQAIARGLHQAPAVVEDARFEDLGAMRRERGDRAFLVESDKAAVTGDVGRQHGR